MPFNLTFLGSNSAVPAHGRYTSAQVLQVKNRLYLIDCGEGAQWRLPYHGVSKREKIEQIFISHLHGDHIYGLPGFLTSLSLSNRTKPLTIFSPEGLEDMLRSIFKHSYVNLSYEIDFVTVPTDKSVKIHSDSQITVHTIPLKHRIPTTGYLFREVQKPDNILPEKLEEYNIPFEAIPAIKKGEGYTLPNGKVIPHKELTKPAPAPRSFAYCSDTSYTEDIIPIIKNVSLLYHETTYLHDAIENAKKYGHSTALEAARIAKAANVNALICGHYSSRYSDIKPHKKEAKTVFENTFLGLDGRVFSVDKNGKVKKA